MSKPLCAEDLEAGTTVDLGITSVTQADIIKFATEFDPLPMHIDPDSAEARAFGGVIASGIHTIALFARQQVPWLKCVDVVAGLGIDRLRFPTPLRPDRPIQVSIVLEAIEARDIARSVMHVYGRMTTPDGVVLDKRSRIVVRRRTPTGSVTSMVG